MASIISDSELMTNYASAAAIPPSSNFVPLNDEHGRPMILALSDATDKSPRKLQLIKEDGDGNHFIFDMSKALALDQSSPILNFDAQQWSDGRVFLVFAVKKGDDGASLKIVKPFRTATEIMLGGLLKLQYIPGPQSTLGTVHSIHLNPVKDASQYPMITLAHKPYGRFGDGSDISVISVDVASNTSVVFRDQIVRENALEIIDLAPAVTRYGQGVFCLYSIQEERHIMILTSDIDSGTGEFCDREALLKCPADASSLATFTGTGGCSALLVSSSQGLTYFDVKAAGEGGKPGVLISKDAQFQNCKQMSTAQDKNSISIWATTNSDELSYCRTTIEDITSMLKPVTLLPAGMANMYRPLIQSTGKDDIVLQTLLVNDSKGNLQLLNQSSDTGLWQNQPFHVADSHEIIEVNSYTTRVVLQDEDLARLNRGRAFVVSSAITYATCNGRRVTLTQSGSWITADESGELTFITPTQDIGIPTMTFERIQDSTGGDIKFKSTIVDPSKKVMGKLANIDDTFDFSKAKTQSNQPLFNGDGPDKETLKSAKECFIQLNRAYNTLPNNGSSIATAAGALSVSKATLITRTTLEAVGDLIWDAWYYVERKIKDVRDWIVEKVGDVWRFACTIGGSVKEFVLDCAEKVGRAATWVFSKIKLGWDKVCDFVGFLFSWGDILDTQKSLNGFLSANLELAKNMVDQKRTEVGKTFKMVRNKVADAVYPKGIKAQPGKDEIKDPEMKNIMSGSAFNMTSYHMKNGGVEKNSKFQEGGRTPEEVVSDGKTLWTKLLHIWNTIQGELGRLCKAIGKSFYEGVQGIDLDTLFTIIGNVLTSAIDGVAEIVDSIMAFASRFISLLIEYGNKLIDVPIFSGLYKKVTRGQSLTVFSAVSLLVAIPTTIIIKSVTGRAPPKFEGTINSQLLARIKDKKDCSITHQQRIDYNTLMTGAGVSFLLIGTAWKSIKFLWSLARKGTSGAIKLLESKNPFPAMTILSMTIECIGLMTSIPEIDDGLPGAELRRWMATLSTVRVGTNAIFMILGWDADEVGEKFLLGIDVVVALANFALYQAVCVQELTTKEWKDKNEAMTAVGSVASIFSTVASAGYFMAFFFKDKEPTTSGLGVALEKIGTLALVGVETGLFYEQYKHGLETRLVIPT